MKEHKPDVMIWDISPPYDDNWNYLQQILAIPQIKQIQFVITSTNPEKVKGKAGNMEIYEIIGKPFDLKEIVSAVKGKIR